MAHSVITSSESRPTPTIEDYLTVIFIMQRDEEIVIAARLAESMEVAPSTVTVTLKRMERDGWITIEAAKGIRLTDAGCEAASSVIRRHMLTEWLLARMLKVRWSQVHAEADQIEHTISDELESQMRTNLDDPQLCPHGNPFPGYEHIAANWLPLTSVLPGEKVIIRRIHETAEDNHDLLQFLETNGIIPGAQAKVAEILPFNQTITLILKGQKIAIGLTAAKFIFVEEAA